MLSQNMTIGEEVQLVCSTLDKLTRKQVHVLEVLSKHASNREIARHMFLCEQTVKNHMRDIRRRLGVGTKLELRLIADKLVAYKESPWARLS